MSCKEIYAVFDTSGSNIEYGKSRLNRNLLRTLKQLSFVGNKKEYACVDFKYFLLNTSLTEISEKITKDPCEDVPAFKSSGKAELSQLNLFIREKISTAKNLCVLFFSDGNFDVENAQCLAKTLEENKQVHLIVIPIGMDANLKVVNLIKGVVCTPDNILSAVDLAITFLFGKVKMPKSLDELSEISVEDLFS